MYILLISWLKSAALAFYKHPAPRYVVTFALITGCLFTLLPLMNFPTGFQVGLIMGAYNYIATKGMKS